MELLIGADPEFFLKKDGEFVSAHGLIEGTKKNPQKVKGGAVQVDGMALEFNIDPVNNAMDFIYNVETVLGELRKMIPKEYEFAFVPVADFDPAYIADQPEEARILGCEPDYNAYTGKANPQPNAAKTFRTASGHIHLGWTKDEDIHNPEHIDACQMMTKQLDCTLGLSSIVFDRDKRRRELYGKAGAFRPKSYGVEYRTMSNFWLKDPALQEYVFEIAKSSFNHLIKGTSYIDGFTAAGVVDWINNSKLEKAYYYCKIYTKHKDIVDIYYNRWQNEQVKKEPATKLSDAVDKLSTYVKKDVEFFAWDQPFPWQADALVEEARRLRHAPQPVQRIAGDPINEIVFDEFRPVGPNLRRDRLGRFVRG